MTSTEVHFLEYFRRHASGGIISKEHFQAALQEALEKLQISPLPPAEWCASAFRNFDIAQTGFITESDFLYLGECYVKGINEQQQALATTTIDERIKQLCLHSFRWVDPNKSGNITMTQNKTALTLVFQQLDIDAYLPTDEWYEFAFRNFDMHNEGYITYHDMVEIAVQYYDAVARQRHLKKTNVTGALTPLATQQRSFSSSNQSPANRHFTPPPIDEVRIPSAYRGGEYNQSPVNRHFTSPPIDEVPSSLYRGGEYVYPPATNASAHYMGTSPPTRPRAVPTPCRLTNNTLRCSQRSHTSASPVTARPSNRKMEREHTSASPVTARPSADNAHQCHQLSPARYRRPTTPSPPHSQHQYSKTPHPSHQQYTPSTASTRHPREEHHLASTIERLGSPSHATMHAGEEDAITQTLREIDPDHYGLDMQGHRRALCTVISKLQSVLHATYPGDAWADAAFVRFDGDHRRQLGHTAFREVVNQYMRGVEMKHAQRRKAQQEAQARDEDNARCGRQVVAGGEAPQMKIKSKNKIPKPAPAKDPEPEEVALPMPLPRPSFNRGCRKTTSPLSSRPSSSSDENKHREEDYHRGRKARKGRQSLAVSIASHIQCPSYRGKLQVFDDYDFLEKKGEGAFGKVMTVRHKRSNQVRACKALVINSSQQRGLIETEIGLMKQLDHPNVLRLFKCYFDGDRNIYLVIELCNGGSLFDRIQYHHNKLKQAMSETQSARYLQDVLSALGYCHARQIVHRDIKPENLLFVNRKANSTIKVIDFGLSDFMDRIEASAKVEKSSSQSLVQKVLGKGKKEVKVLKKVMPRAGTPHYMAPEMHGVGIYNTQSDLFACGIILYQMLTGMHPFFTLGKDTAETAKNNILRGTVDYPSKMWGHVSPLAKQLTHALLEHDPDRRISASEALQHPWFQSVIPEKKGYVRPSMFPSLVDFPKKNRLKQAVLRLLAKELSEEQIGSMKDQFSLLDTSGDGFITVDELLQSARSCGAYLSENEAMDIVREIGTADFGQKIGYSDFLGAILEQRSEIDESMMWDIFLRFTDDGVEIINAKSLMRALTPSKDTREKRLTDIGAATGVALTNADLEKIFKDFDVTGTEEISFQEFCTLLRCKKSPGA
eukprot:GEMP01003603.1.p1 GENE.GEMP01003603.1~~GEMP01003603.1.p1  ORF type:complete len:1116 (+),score=291.65 GEMP01003603.1:287-3634(+)